MVIEAGLVAGYVIAWAVRKVRRAAGRLDAETDAVIDAGLDKLHEVVGAKLGRHPALEDLDEEAAAEGGEVSELTRQQVELAVTAAARKDDDFGQAVTELVAQLRMAEQARGGSVIAGAGSTVFTGDAHAQTDSGGFAFGQVAGNVAFHHSDAEQRPDPPGPGRSSH
jgi:hypothetical protein